MAYLLALMFTGVTVVRKGCGGGRDSPPRPHFIHLPHAHPIDSCIDRTFYRQEKSSRHVVLVAKCLDLNKPWSEKYGRKKMKRWLFCARLHSGTKRQPILLFPSFGNTKSRLCRERSWDPEILRPWYYLTSHFSTLFSVIIAAVVFVTWVEGKYYAKFMGGWNPVILTSSFGDSTLSLANCILAFWQREKKKKLFQRSENILFGERCKYQEPHHTEKVMKPK